MGSGLQMKEVWSCFFLRLIKKSLWPKISHLLGQPRSETHKLVFGIKTSRLSLKMLLGKWHIKPGLAFNSLLPIKLVFNNTSILSQSFTHLLFLFTPDLSFMVSFAHSGLASTQVCAGWTLSISRDNHGRGPHRRLHFLIGFSFSHFHSIKKKKIHLSSTIYIEDSIKYKALLSEQNFYNIYKTSALPSNKVLLTVHLLASHWTCYHFITLFATKTLITLFLQSKFSFLLFLLFQFIIIV